MKKKSSKEKRRIYISELKNIINREVNTIRRWENDGRLPQHLTPKRGENNRRYWTHAQVHGPRGIIAWMERNDMRPGNLVTDPSKEAEHVEHLRRPKYLNGHHINSARQFADKGKSREFIVKKIFPRTRYAHPENLERALVKLFKAEGWYFPPPKRKKRDKVQRALRRETTKLEARINRLGK